MRMLIVVASQTGRTRRMADELAAGAREEDAAVEIAGPEEVAEEQVLAADALVLGSGVHMAGVESPMRAFLERLAPLWMRGALIGKVGAAFASAGSGARGGAELALISMLASLAEHGMILVPMHNRLDGYASGGCHWGPVAWTSPRAGEAGPTSAHLLAARSHGRHVARCTARWLDGKPS